MTITTYVNYNSGVHMLVTELSTNTTELSIYFGQVARLLGLETSELVLCMFFPRV